jgi:sigma-B regulation protein RsbU (phosphoserine phosphatase)
MFQSDIASVFGLYYCGLLFFGWPNVIDEATLYITGSVASIISDVNHQLVADVEHSGQIIFLSTDGIWEAFNPKGEMFGKERIYDIIRKNSILGAEEIVQKTFAALDNFQQGAPIEDDITLVISKIND